MWFDGPFSGVTVSGTRIRNVIADGINFCNGISNSRVQQTIIRNSGDDGLAMWSNVNNDFNNTFDSNTVQDVVLANNIAIYGGYGNTVSNNYVSDNVEQGSGIQIANRFG